MPEKQTLARARKAKRQGKAASTQAGEFVREEIHHVREGKHGARSTQQAIAIGLSKARRSGVKLPARGKSANRKRTAATQRSRRSSNRPSPRRARAARKALDRAPRNTASKQALSRQAKQSARRRPASARKASARKAARTRAKNQSRKSG